MKKNYEELEFQILILCEDVVTVSGEVDGDETKYPVPGGWAGLE